MLPVLLHEVDTRGSAAPGCPHLQTGRWAFGGDGGQPLLACRDGWGETGWSSGLEEHNENRGQHREPGTLDR